MPRTVSVQIVERIACDTGERLTRRLIRKLQATSPVLLKDNGARNLWEEICVQTQRDSDDAGWYRSEMEALLRPMVTGLSAIERVALWLSAAEEYRLSDYDDSGGFHAAKAAIEEPVLVEHILNDHVMYEAVNYENASIRAMTGL